MELRRTLYLATSCGHSRKGHGRRQQEDADVPFMSALVVTRSWQGRGGTWRTGGERCREGEAGNEECVEMLRNIQEYKAQ